MRQVCGGGGGQAYSQEGPLSAWRDAHRFEPDAWASLCATEAEALLRRTFAEALLAASAKAMRAASKADREACVQGRLDGI